MDLLITRPSLVFTRGRDFNRKLSACTLCILEGRGSFRRKVANGQEQCRFHAIGASSSVSGTTSPFCKRKFWLTHNHAPTHSTRSGIEFRLGSIDRSIGRRSRGTRDHVTSKRGCSTFSKASRSYRERLIAQLSRRIARSEIIFIHRRARVSTRTGCSGI